MNERQLATLALLHDYPNQSCDAIGAHLVFLGLVKRSRKARQNYCLAGSAVAHSLERLGLVVCFPNSRDQWAVKLWALTPKGQDAIGRKD